VSLPDGRDQALFYQRVFAVGSLGLLAWLLYLVIQPFLKPLAWAALVAVLLFPLQRRLTTLWGGRENLSAAVLTVLVVLMFVGPLTALAVAFAAQAAQLAELVPGWVARAEDLLTSGSVDWLARLQALVPIEAAELHRWVSTGARQLLQRAASAGGSAFLGAVGTILSFTVMLFLLFFFLRDGALIATSALRLVPVREERKGALVRQLTAVTQAVVVGTVLTAIVQGLLLGVGFAIVGLPAPVVFGVLGGVLSVVPFGGTALVWVPGVIALLIAGDYTWGAFLAAWGTLLVSSVDNFLKPLLISGRAEVPTLAVFVGVLGGLSAFGLVGMFVGPVVIALALALARLRD